MNSDAKEKLAIAVGFLLAASSLAIIAVFVGGWAVTVFWNRFGPPMFGMPEAEWRNGIGLVGFLLCIRGCLGCDITIKSRRQ